MARVYTVDKVRCTIDKTWQTILVVTADGTTRSGGYSGPFLARRTYLLPPQDGIQDYDFEATPPTVGAIRSITPITARDEWKDVPPWVLGARVHAETNAQEVVLWAEIW